MSGWITKTKTKRYIGVCPKCKHVITQAMTFRIQASEAVRHHLKTVHNMTEEEAKKL